MLKNKLILLVSLLILGSCGIIRKLDSDPISVTELNYGILNLDILSNDTLESAPEGVRNITSTKFNLVEKTDSIPARDNVQFGVEYQINSSNQESVIVELVWSYPDGMLNKEGEELVQTRYEIGKRTNIRQSSNYTLDEGLYVKGTWVFQIYYEGKEIFKKKFYLF
jgi:hypothetical protein